MNRSQKWKVVKDSDGCGDNTPQEKTGQKSELVSQNESKITPTREKNIKDKKIKNIKISNSGVENDSFRLTDSLDTLPDDDCADDTPQDEDAKEW